MRLVLVPALKASIILEVETGTSHLKLVICDLVAILSHSLYHPSSCSAVLHQGLLGTDMEDSDGYEIRNLIKGCYT